MFFYFGRRTLTVMTPKFCLETLLNKFPSRVKVKSPGEVQRKIDQMCGDGPSKLQVISDFDYTFSKFQDENGERCWTTHAIFDFHAQEYDADLAKELNALRSKYMAIEFDPEMTIAEKIPHMLTWWTTAHARIARAAFTRSTLEKFVRNGKVVLRDNCAAMLKMLEKANIPVVLFSAGIGDLIDIFLQQQLSKTPDNLHIISNMMEFSNDVVVGFKDPLIHTFNKNSEVVEGEKDFFGRLKNRPNVLLLGDSLGDLHMDVGVQEEADIVKIGFLNMSDERLLPKYLDGYDIVLLQDSSMDIPLEIISTVISES